MVTSFHVHDFSPESLQQPPDSPPQLSQGLLEANKGLLVKISNVPSAYKPLDADQGYDSYSSEDTEYKTLHAKRKRAVLHSAEQGGEVLWDVK